MKMVCISTGDASFILDGEEIKIPLIYGKTYTSGDVLDMYEEHLWIYYENKPSALLEKKHFVTLEQWREIQLDKVI